MMNFYEYLQLRTNEAGEIPPTAGAAQAPAQASGATPTQAPAQAASSLNIQQLATISDKALDDAYHYGRSTPGNTFGWQANLKSAEFAKKIIDSGVLEAKLQQRQKLMNIDYAGLPNDEQEKDRVVARALLSSLKGNVQPGKNESWMRGVFGESPSKKKYDGID